jgi:negative regulator of flagellin synthesis FlgM
MDIRSSMDGLKSLLGVNPAAPSAHESRSAAATAASGNALDGDRATLSSAGSEAAQTVSDEGVRTDKVASIQAALAQGTYNVPASAVASKMVDAMLEPVSPSVQVGAENE